MSETFDVDWLLLREPFDGFARSAAVAARLIAALPARPRLLDLGAGTGSLLRWLAPRIGRAQAWTLVDADRAMADEAFETMAEFAAARCWTTTWPSRRTLLVHAPGGAWRIECLTADLAEAPANLPLRQVDAVTSSALCDLVSEAWLARMAAALRVPFYAALCVDGRDRWHPPHRADARIAGAFRRDQARDKGFGGRALGATAPAAIQRIFGDRGFAVSSGASDWAVRPRGVPTRVRPLAQRFLGDLAAGHARAARARLPRRDAVAIFDWELARIRAVRDRLSVRIGHRDVLALPGSHRVGDGATAAL